MEPEGVMAFVLPFHCERLQDGESFAALYYTDSTIYASLLGGLIRYNDEAFLFRHRMSPDQALKFVREQTARLPGYSERAMLDGATATRRVGSIGNVSLVALRFWSTAPKFEELLATAGFPFWRDGLFWPVDKKTGRTLTQVMKLVPGDKPGEAFAVSGRIQILVKWSGFKS